MNALVHGREGVAGAGPGRPAVPAGTRLDVAVRDIVKRFGETAALHGVSLDIAGGELIALLGPSGSGKTTLLRILAGLDRPTGGQVLFGGEDAAGLSVQERNVGFVFQHYALFKHMTVFDNIAFGLKVRPRARRPSAAAIRERVLTLLDLVQLPGLEKRYPAQLSGGQRQRVALARALAIEPRILLLDEPFGALDAKVRRELRRWLRELHERIGHTAVFVTHDQEEALELADRVVILNRGRIEQVGTPDGIYERPATAFVFGFIGEANALPVVLAGGAVLLDDIALPLEARGHPDGRALLHFRPHEVAAAPGGGEGIQAIVTGLRRHGGVRRAELEAGIGRHRVEADLPPGLEAGPGSRLALRPTRVALYPEEAGDRGRIG